MTDIIAELIGTMFLILLGNGVVANVVLKDTIGHNSGWIVITTGWALAVFAGVTIAAPYSGAHLNPAVTIALALAKKFSWTKVLPYIAAQLAGAMLGSFLVWLQYRDHFAATEQASAKLASFATGPAIKRNSSNLISEIIGSFVLIFVIFYFTGADMSTGTGALRTPIGLGTIGAIPVTFLVWSIGLSLGGTTGYAINPARDLGPRIMHAILPIPGKGASNWTYAWIPVAGPIIGGALAAGVYGWLTFAFKQV